MIVVPAGDPFADVLLLSLNFVCDVVSVMCVFHCPCGHEIRCVLEE